MSDYEEEEDELNRILEGRNDDYERPDSDEDEVVGETKSRDGVASSARSGEKKTKRVKRDERRAVDSEDGDDGYQVDVDYEDEGLMGDDEAIEVPEKKTGAEKAARPKRVVLNPQPKLDGDRLTSKNGLVQLQDLLGEVRFKGKGHEKDYLDKLLFRLEHWAHRLYPKMRFDDFIERVEQLGHKAQVKTFVKKIRYDLPLGLDPEEDVVVNQVEDEDENEQEKEQSQLQQQVAFEIASEEPGEIVMSASELTTELTSEMPTDHFIE